MSGNEGKMSHTDPKLKVFTNGSVGVRVISAS